MSLKRRLRRVTRVAIPEDFAVKPQPGDGVVQCGHVATMAEPSVHWWRFPEPLTFRAPDGSQVEAIWKVACAGCFDRYGAAHGMEIPVCGHGVIGPDVRKV